MLTTFMKWAASTALLAGLLLRVFRGRYGLGHHVGTASVAVFRAASLREYRWVVAFGVVACLFNPIVSFGFLRAPTLVVNTLTLILLVLSLKLLKTPPQLCIASITDSVPGSESLSPGTKVAKRYGEHSHA